jgi:hypothetical protein
VNFLDETEANLRDRVPGEEGELSQSAAGIVAESGPASDPLFWVLLATVAIAIAGNWYVLGHEGSRA